jgi:hypothetical protein
MSLQPNPRSLCLYTKNCVKAHIKGLGNHTKSHSLGEKKPYLTNVCFRKNGFTIRATAFRSTESNFVLRIFSRGCPAEIACMIIKFISIPMSYLVKWRWFLPMKCSANQDTDIFGLADSSGGQRNALISISEGASGYSVSPRPHNHFALGPRIRTNAGSNTEDSSIRANLIFWPVNNVAPLFKSFHRNYLADSSLRRNTYVGAIFDYVYAMRQCLNGVTYSFPSNRVTII